MHIHCRNLENSLKHKEGKENHLLFSLPKADDRLIFWCFVFHHDIPGLAETLRQPCFLPMSKRQPLVTSPGSKPTFTK